MAILQIKWHLMFNRTVLTFPTPRPPPPINPFKPEFIIVTFIHYKPRIAVAILGL